MGNPAVLIWSLFTLGFHSVISFSRKCQQASESLTYRLFWNSLNSFVGIAINHYVLGRLLSSTVMWLHLTPYWCISDDILLPSPNGNILYVLVQKILVVLREQHQHLYKWHVSFSVRKNWISPIVGCATAVDWIPTFWHHCLKRVLFLITTLTISLHHARHFRSIWLVQHKGCYSLMQWILCTRLFFVFIILFLVFIWNFSANKPINCLRAKTSYTIHVQPNYDVNMWITPFLKLDRRCVY